MNTKIKQCISELIDDEISEKDLATLLVYMEKNPKASQTYSDYLFVSDCAKSNFAGVKQFDISAQVMREICCKKGKILKFSPRHISELAIAASTFFAITLGFYFYNAEPTNSIASNQLQLKQGMELNLEQPRIMQSVSLGKTNQFTLPRYSQKPIQPNEVYINPQVKQYLFDVDDSGQNRQ